MEIAKPGHMPGVHHSSEGGGEGLLTIRCNSWFWIICPSGFRFFLASSLLSPGGAEVLPSWFLSFSVSHLHLFSLALSFSIAPSVYFSFHHFITHSFSLSPFCSPSPPSTLSISLPPFPHLALFFTFCSCLSLVSVLLFLVTLTGAIAVSHNIITVSGHRTDFFNVHLQRERILHLTCF